MCREGVTVVDPRRLDGTCPFRDRTIETVSGRLLRNAAAGLGRGVPFLTGADSTRAIRLNRSQQHG